MRDVFYCEDCLAQHVGLPPATATATPPVIATIAPGGPEPLAPYAPAAVPARHNSAPVVAFLLGFIPGLGAIYNGEYNKAIVHVVIFGGIIFGLASDLGEGVQAILIFAVVIFPIYMAIDAMRSAKSRLTGVPVSDPFENWSSQRPLGPVILIGVGALILLNNFGIFEFLHLREAFVPLILIGIGFYMLRNRIGRKS